MLFGLLPSPDGRSQSATSMCRSRRPPFPGARLHRSRREPPTREVACGGRDGHSLREGALRAAAKRTPARTRARRSLVTREAHGAARVRTRAALSERVSDALGWRKLHSVLNGQISTPFYGARVGFRPTRLPKTTGTGNRLTHTPTNARNEVCRRSQQVERTQGARETAGDDCRTIKPTRSARPLGPSPRTGRGGEDRKSSW